MPWTVRKYQIRNKKLVSSVKGCSGFAMLICSLLLGCKSEELRGFYSNSCTGPYLFQKNCVLVPVGIIHVTYCGMDGRTQSVKT